MFGVELSFTFSFRTRRQLQKEWVHNWFRDAIWISIFKAKVFSCPPYDPSSALKSILPIIRSDHTTQSSCPPSPSFSLCLFFSCCSDSSHLLVMLSIPLPMMSRIRRPRKWRRSISISPRMAWWWASRRGKTKHMLIGRRGGSCGSCGGLVDVMGMWCKRWRLECAPQGFKIVLGTFTLNDCWPIPFFFSASSSRHGTSALGPPTNPNTGTKTLLNNTRHHRPEFHGDHNLELRNYPFFYISSPFTPRLRIWGRTCYCGLTWLILA